MNPIYPTFLLISTYEIINYLFFIISFKCVTRIPDKRHITRKIEISIFQNKYDDARTLLRQADLFTCAEE